MNEELDNIENDDLLGIMRTEHGRRVLNRILKYANVDDDIFDADTHIHAKNAGRREIAVWLRNEIIGVAPDEYLIMLQEHTNGRRTKY